MILHRVGVVIGVVALLTACSTAKPPQRIGTNPYPCTYPVGRFSGAFYKDDGPGDSMPADIDHILEPIPKAEPLHRFANRPYTVLSKNYVPRLQVGNFVQEGMGSWYGRKFHGQKTSSGEPYNMYAMTAAHPTLPIPSYVRVTNQKNGRSVVVRINDRGPFHKSRVIDVSFLAACRLGYAVHGSAPVKVEALLPGQPTYLAQDTPQQTDRAAMSGLPATDTIMKIPLEPLKGGVFIQLGAFSAPSNAESFRTKVAEILNQPIGHIRLQNIEGTVRVRMGPFKNKETAMQEAERLTGDHNLQAVVVH
jgi:rare lipoprotein A